MSDQREKLLLVAPAPDLVKACKSELFIAFDIVRCDKLTDADRQLESEKPAILILDNTLHELSALEYCNTVRNSTSNPFLPILIIGQQASTVHEIEAFRAGASDYIARPFDQNVLYYRITSRLGGINFYQTEPPKKSFDRLKIDTEGYTVHLDGKIINLSRKEFELLKMLHSKPGRVYSREEIFEKVWKKDPEASDRTIDVHILRLRKKLGNSFIGTQKGVGYRFSG